MPLVLEYSFYYVASPEATGCPGEGWEGEFLKPCCWGQLSQKLSKNAEEDISINTWDQNDQKKKKAWKIKLCEDSGELWVFPAFYLGEAFDFNTKVTYLSCS